MGNVPFTKEAKKEQVRIKNIEVSESMLKLTGDSSRNMKAR